MQSKEIFKLKRQMSKICNKAINNMIEQLIANEDIHKVSQSDPNAAFQAISLNVNFVLNLEDKDNKVKPFQIVCNPLIDLK